MPTQEERIQSLERTQGNLVRSVSDLNHHVTIIEGILTQQEIDIRDIKNSVRTINDRLGVFEQSVNNRLEIITSRFEVINRHFEVVDNRFEAVDKRLDEHDKRFDSIDEKLNQIVSLLTSKPE